MHLSTHFVYYQAAYEEEKRRRYEEQAALLRQIRPHHIMAGQVTIGPHGAAPTGQRKVRFAARRCCLGALAVIECNATIAAPRTSAFRRR